MTGSKTYVIMPNSGEMDLQYLVETVTYLRGLRRTFKIWELSSALIEKSGGSSRQYIGQKFDPTYFEVVTNGWTHDHCEICFATISNNKNLGEIEGYTTDNCEWICKNCFNGFIAPENIDTIIPALKTVTK